MMSFNKLKAAFLIIILIAAFIIFLKNSGNEKDKILIENGINIETTTEEAVAERPDIIVDVSGAVNAPSVVILPEGSRVYEAIEAAGGLCDDASINTLNRAAVLNDGDKLYVPSMDEQQQLRNQTSISTGLSNASSLVNINTATSDELQTLSGIGPSTAEKIILFRSSNGAFRSIEELMDVNGIGEKTFGKIKDKLCI